MALREGNERQPKHPVPSMVPPEGGTAYFVRDGDTWDLVAHNYHLDAKELIRYNFKTTDPKEVNWYLHWYVGCKLPDLPQYNWTFSSGIKGGMGYWKKGVIYLPPGANLDCPIGEICFSKEEGDEIFVHYVTMRVPTADDRKQGQEFLNQILEAARERARRLASVDPNVLDDISDAVGFINNLVDVADGLGIALGTFGEVVGVVGIPFAAYDMLREIGAAAVAGDLANLRRRYYRALTEGIAAALYPPFDRSGNLPAKPFDRYVYGVGYLLIQKTPRRQRFQLMVALIETYYFRRSRTQPHPRTAQDYAALATGDNLYESLWDAFNQNEYLIR